MLRLSTENGRKILLRYAMDTDRIEFNIEGVITTEITQAEAKQLGVMLERLADYALEAQELMTKKNRLVKMFEKHQKRVDTDMRDPEKIPPRV